MYDYSLHHVKSRPAKVGDKLTTTNFNTGTRGFAAPEDSRRDQMQDVLDAAVNDRVPGVVAALTADNNVCLGSKDVDDLPLALISPLHAN